MATKHWWQFTLREILFLTLIVGLLLALANAYRQQVALRVTIEQYRAYVAWARQGLPISQDEWALPLDYLESVENPPLESEVANEEESDPFAPDGSGNQ